MTDIQDNKKDSKISARPQETDTGQVQQREAQPESGFDALQRRALLFALVVLAVGLGLAALVVSDAYLSYRYGAPKVVATVPAGRVLAVQLHGGLFSRALVETDIGFYSLEEGVSFLKGEMLMLQERWNRSRFLCDSGQHCTRLLRPRE